MKVVSAIAIGMMLSGTAGAQPGNEESLFNKLDVDKDGELSSFEASADTDLLEHFNELDQNGDGRLTRQEFAAYEQRK